jgi:hypothetical protein
MTRVATGVRCAICAAVLDPNLFPYRRLRSGSAEGSDVVKRFGPFKLYKGETAELVATPDLNLSRVDIHHSAP